MSDLDDIIEGKEPEPVEPAPQEQPAEPPQAAEPEKPEEPAKEPDKQDHMVPASVVAELRRELRELKAKPPEPRPAPDMFADPDGYTQHMQTQFQQAVQSTRLDMSEHLAKQAHGEQAVSEAFAALEAAVSQGDRMAYQTIMSDPMPYDRMVKWHRQQKVMADIGDDVDGWRKRERDALRKEIEAELATKQIKDAAAQPAPSLANRNGSGGASSPGWAGPADLDALLG